MVNLLRNPHSGLWSTNLATDTQSRISVALRRIASLRQSLLLQGEPQCPRGEVQPGLHCAFGDLEFVGDLGRRQTLVVRVADDGAVLGGAGLCAFLLVGSLWAPLAIATCLYYIAGTILTGATPGMSLQAWRRGRQGPDNVAHPSSATKESPTPFPIAPEQSRNLSPELSLR